MGNCARLKLGLIRAVLASALLALAGCAATPPPAEPEPAPIVVEAIPEPPPEPLPPPPPAPEPARAPTPARPPRADIALVVGTSSESHATVAAAIVAELPPRAYNVVEVVSTATAELATLRDRALTIVAIGAEAVAAARTELPGKDIVFCQVLGYETLIAAGERIWGVRPLPPLALQLRAWRAVDPSLRTIALVVSDPEDALAVEAQQAAGAAATDLHVEISSSDRETLYVFRRIAADIDGLWLLPDEKALSPSVLRELLSYAATRGISVLTFSEALLARGALLSATSVPADVAATVHRIVERVVAGRADDLPAMTPLSAAEFAVNRSLAVTFGLPPPVVSRWVTRDPD
jgi:ABC-type uncharacterized transport system substrate-binding protein